MPGLDGLRAISVLAVIAYHLNLKWAQGGLLGVGIFLLSLVISLLIKLSTSGKGNKDLIC